MTIHSNFWPLDFDQEVEIYDNPSWNLPGRCKKHKGVRCQRTTKISRPMELKTDS
jgi:hypothetical protein